MCEEELWQKHEREDHVEQAERLREKKEKLWLSAIELVNAYRLAYGTEPLEEIDPPKQP